MIIRNVKNHGLALSLSYMTLFAGLMYISHLVVSQPLKLEGGAVGWLDDVANLLNHLLLVPVGILLISRFERATDAIAKCPLEESFLVEERLHPGRFQSWFERWGLLLCLGLGLVITLMSESGTAPEWQQGVIRFRGQWSLPAMLFKIFTTLNYAVILFMLVRGSGFLLSIMGLKARDIVVHPFHEDELGGAGLLSRAALEFSTFVTLIALFLLNQAYVAEVFLKSDPFKLLMIVYAVFYFAVLFFPFRHLSLLIEGWKTNRYRKLREQYPALFRVREPDELFERIADDDDAVECLRDAQDVIRNIPSWPVRLLPLVGYLLGNLIAPKTFDILVNALI